MIIQFQACPDDDPTGIEPMRLPDGDETKILAILATLHASVTVTHRNGELHCQVSQEEP
jgi:hypothetical protein